MIKKILKYIIPDKLLEYIRKIRTINQKIEYLENSVQNIIWMNYSKLSCYSDQKSILKKHENKIYSQHGEDGLILFIFSKIGVEKNTLVEIGIEDGRECNSANLLINFGWQGLLIEGNAKHAESAKKFYSDGNRVLANKVNVVHTFVTKENINQILLNNNYFNEIDFLSIDIDGNDLWIWDTIDVVNPRVVMIEYNSIFGYQDSITIKYDPEFQAIKKHASGWYYGASLMALNKVAEKKGYSLIGCDSSGVNAIFVKNTELKNKLFKINVEEAFYDQQTRIKYGSPSERFKRISNLEYSTV